jgi:hypothetical protein
MRKKKEFPDIDDFRSKPEPTLHRRLLDGFELMGEAEDDDGLEYGTNGCSTSNHNRHDD